MIAFAVESITALRHPVELDGQSILAHLAVSYGGLRLTGCNLVRSDAGQMRVWMPSRGRARVVLTDKDEREQLLHAALSAYRALTGRDPADTPLATAPSMDQNHDPSRDAGAPRGHCG